MKPSDIAADDAELVELVAAIMAAHGKAALSVNDILQLGPHRRTRLYPDLNAGRLTTFMTGGRRFALVTDFARYLLAIKRESPSDDGKASERARERRQGITVHAAESEAT